MQLACTYSSRVKKVERAPAQLPSSFMSLCWKPSLLPSPVNSYHKDLWRGTKKKKKKKAGGGERSNWPRVDDEKRV